MGKYKKKADERLAARIAGYDAIRNKGAFKKPGSQNPHKQGGSSKSKRY